MKKVACFGLVCIGVSVAALSWQLTFGQPPGAPAGTTADPVRRYGSGRQPGGKLNDHLGVYHTIEGIRATGGKVETGTLLVDTVDGKKLDKPIPLLVRGAVVENHNLQEATLRLSGDQRFVFKGFETGEMVGVAPAVAIVAQEQGWAEVPQSAAGWQWRPYFVALVAVEPEGFELRKR